MPAKNILRGIIPLIIFSLLASNVDAKTLRVDEIAIYIENNLDVKLAKLDQELAQTELLASFGDFDIQLALSYFKSYEDEAQSTILENTSVIEQTTGQSIGLNKKFTLGTELDFTLQGMEKTSNSINRAFDKWYQSAALIKVSQPLLKGFGKDYNLVKYKQSEFKIQRYLAKYKKTFQEKLLESYDLFWDISTKDLEIKLRKQNIESYEKLNNYFAKAKNLGVKGDIKRIEVASILTNEKALLLLVQNERKNLFLKINKLLNSNFNEVDSNISPEITSKFIGKEIDVSLVPEVMEEKLSLEEEKISLKKLDNSRMPSLNLSVEYLLPGISDDRSDSWSQINSNMFPNTKVSLNFSWSFGNSYAQGKYAEQLAKIRSQKQKILKLKQQKGNSLKMDFENIKEVKSIYEEGLLQKENFQEKLKIKQRMYQSGVISLIELNQTIIDNTNQLISWHEQKIEYLRKLNTNYINYNNTFRGEYGTK